jgi:hypothetical protein
MPSERLQKYPIVEAPKHRKNYRHLGSEISIYRFEERRHERGINLFRLSVVLDGINSLLLQ